LKQRFFIIIGVIILLVIIAIAASASGPKPATGVFGKVYTITVNADVGVASIQITNQNSPSTKPWTILPSQLPYNFNCTSGDTISFNASAKEGFVFNYWYPNSGMPYSSNPYMVKVQQPLTVTAQSKPEATP